MAAPGRRGCFDGAPALTPYNPDSHHRRSIRLRSYNYTQDGAYFITICTQDRDCLSGEIVAGTMRQNEPGRMIEHSWDELGEKFPTLTTDAFVLMPNHIHGIIILADAHNAPATNPVGADLRVRPALSSDAPHVLDRPIAPAQGGHAGPPLPVDHPTADQGGYAGPPLHRAVQWFKTMATNDYIRGVKESAWPPFRKRLWQRNYYEHIIRGESSLRRIQEYIVNNPQQWELDQLNPENPSKW
jgi:REP element-mobilizing transposase RayT